MTEAEVIQEIEAASQSMESALSCAHRYRRSPELKKATLRLDADVRQLVSIFLEEGKIVQEYWAISNGKRYLLRVREATA